MIPVSILVKLLEVSGIIGYIGIALSPMMELVGLPGETGLVWATTMLTNIYGGMLVYFSLPLQLTVAQITVLSTLMLVAHTLPVELRVAQKAGVSLIAMFLIRFLFAFFSAFLMNLIYKFTHTLQYVSEVKFQLIEQTVSKGWLDWLLHELQKYALISFYIFCLIALMRLLKAIGFIDLMANSLKPVLSVLGISRDVIPITVIGSTLGILYGGALIIKESEEKQLNKMDVFYAMTLMGLCHSLIEDSILMLSLGAHYSGVFIFRMFFAFAMTWLIVRITKKLPGRVLKKYLLA